MRHKNLMNILLATEEDWSTEYLLPIVSIKIVNSLNEPLNILSYIHQDIQSLFLPKILIVLQNSKKN